MTTKEQLLEAVARGWCHPENGNKVMDEALAVAIADEVEAAIRSEQKPYLGYASTRQLITELAARAEVAEVVGEAWPKYRTVESGG